MVDNRVAFCGLLGAAAIIVFLVLGLGGGDEPTEPLPANNSNLTDIHWNVENLTIDINATDFYTSD